MAAVMLCSGALFIGYLHGENNGYHAGYERGQSITIAQPDTGWETESYQAGYQAGHESGLKEASGYNLHNPSYQEMMDFLSQDTTDSIPYVTHEHMCVDYAAQVNNNAEAKGIRCATVYILNNEGIGHTIIAFETTDRGFQFVEPQYDRVVRLVIGQSYSKLNSFLPQPDDDTIDRYLIIW